MTEIVEAELVERREKEFRQDEHDNQDSNDPHPVRKTPHNSDFSRYFNFVIL